MKKQKKNNLKTRTVNGFTVERERQYLRETEEAFKYGKRYDNIEELHVDILK